MQTAAIKVITLWSSGCAKLLSVPTLNEENAREVKIVNTYKPILLKHVD